MTPPLAANARWTRPLRGGLREARPGPAMAGGAGMRVALKKGEIGGGGTLLGTPHPGRHAWEPREDGGGIPVTGCASRRNPRTSRPCGGSKALRPPAWEAGQVGVDASTRPAPAGYPGAAGERRGRCGHGERFVGGPAEGSASVKRPVRQCNVPVAGGLARRATTDLTAMVAAADRRLRPTWA